MRFLQKKPVIAPVMDLRQQTRKDKVVVNLKTPFLKKYRVHLSTLVAVLTISSILFARFFTQAAAAYFYPSSCLGTWRNISYAEGKPQATEVGKITPSTSALFDERAQDIYCGGFEGEVPEGSAIQSLTLNLRWRATQQLLTEESIKIDAEQPATGGSGSPLDTGSGSGGAVSGEALPNSILDVPATSPVEFEIRQINPDGTPVDAAPAPEPAPAPAPEPTPEPTPTPSPAPEPTPLPAPEPAPAPAPAPEPTPAAPTGGAAGGAPSSFRWIPVVHAQEAATETPPPVAPTPEPTPETTPAPAPEVAPVVETPAPTGPATEIPIQINPDGTPVPPTEVAPVVVEQAGNNFLVVQYTLDGNEWKVLKNVNLTNMNEGIVLPITEWSEIGKLQVKVSRLQTLDAPPYVYLDGMELAAQYDDGESARTPDFVQDQPLVIRSNDRYVLVETLQHSDGKHVLWLYERGEHPQWRVVVEGDGFAFAGPVALKGSNIFWLSSDMNAISGFRGDTSTYFSKSLDPAAADGVSLLLEEDQIKITLQNGQFVFSDVSDNTFIPSDDDAVFSSGFWAFAASMSTSTTGVVTSTASTTVDLLTSSTLAVTSTVDVSSTLPVELPATSPVDSDAPTSSTP